MKYEFKSTPSDSFRQLHNKAKCQELSLAQFQANPLTI